MASRLRHALIVSTDSGRREWQITAFGDRRLEKVLNYDDSAWIAACERILAAVA